MDSRYVVHIRATEGEGRHGVKETREDLAVFARKGASLTGVVALVSFLSEHCADMGAHDVRRMLAPISDLEPLPNPPSAVNPTNRVPMPTPSPLSGRTCGHAASYLTETGCAMCDAVRQVQVI